MTLTERQKAALVVLFRRGAPCSAAQVGRELNPRAGTSHGGGAATLRSLETLGLVERRLSNTWSTGRDEWRLTKAGREATPATAK